MSTPAVALSTPADFRHPPSGGDSAPIQPTPFPVQFDASKHLSYSAPPKKVMMQDIGLAPTALSPMASTEPFPLLSYEAILQHRREIFSPEVLDNCLHTTPPLPGSAFVRGMAPRYAPFINSFWNSPEVLKIISDNAGVDLVPAMDYEVCHTNVQLGPDGLAGVRSIPVEPPAATADTIAAFARKDSVASKDDDDDDDDAKDASKCIVEWHKDSHPFVCVVMLSDARNMQGGETELRCGDGSTVKVRAPQMGGAVILQGRYISHTALPTTNMGERITIVTSFRPRDPRLLDETTNANTTDKSHLPELYYQWTTYRLEVLAQRARLAVDALRAKYAENVRETDADGKPGLCWRRETVDVKEVEEWVEAQTRYLRDTLAEMRVGY